MMRNFLLQYYSMKSSVKQPIPDFLKLIFLDSSNVANVPCSPCFSERFTSNIRYRIHQISLTNKLIIS